MSLINSLFGKKKKTLKAHCGISKEPIEQGYGYLLTTADVVTSQKFWDNIMTEPDTMSYTISHFKNNDQMATQMRQMIFEKYSTVNKPWIISDSYIHLFEVNKSESKQNAKNWWANNGDFAPKNTGIAEENLDEITFNSVKKYAVMEAGKERVA